MRRLHDDDGTTMRRDDAALQGGATMRRCRRRRLHDDDCTTMRRDDAARRCGATMRRRRRRRLHDDDCTTMRRDDAARRCGATMRRRDATAARRRRHDDAALRRGATISRPLGRTELLAQTTTSRDGGPDDVDGDVADTVGDGAFGDRLIYV
jgi:hypothetical protein